MCTGMGVVYVCKESVAYICINRGVVYIHVKRVWF